MCSGATPGRAWGTFGVSHMQGKNPNLFLSLITKKVVVGFFFLHDLI